MEDHTSETKAPETQTSPPPGADPARSPISPREMVRQIYLISAVVIVLLSLAIWLMIRLS